MFMITKSLMRLVPSTEQATFFYGVVCLLGGWLIEEPGVLAIGCLFTLLGVCWVGYTRFIAYLWRRYSGLDAGLRLSVGAAVLTIYTRWTQEPAYAFLGRACGVLKKITSSTGLGGGSGIGDTGASGNVTRLIEATIFIVRGLFLVYLAISAVNVFKLMQRDEDWQTAVRAPLIAVVMVAVVEGISVIVAPNVTETC
jgi:hypothetical protein